MTDSRPPIPDPMKREVRQRCGFGCIVCGMPLYEYDHIEEWTLVRKHQARNITLLCDKHHREKTSGLLLLEDVRRADSNPYNKREGASSPYQLHFSGKSCRLLLGNSVFQRSGLGEGMGMVAVAIDREPLLAFAFEQGHLLLTIQVHDEAHQRVLWIEKNELRYRPTAWDIQFVGRTLTVREGRGEILVELAFNPPSDVEVRRGRFSLNGLELLVEPSCFCYVNNRNVFSGVGAEECDVAIGVGEPLEAGVCGFFLGPSSRGTCDRRGAEEAMRIAREELGSPE